MIRNNLPRDWITLNSKTRPDKVYYYNVKTKQSSWEVPLTEENPMEQIKKRRTNSKKRKPPEEEVLPVTSESDISRNEVSTRKKLVARRFLKRTEETVTQENETPQMKEIREKILKKKEKVSQQVQVKSPKNITKPQMPDKSSPSKLNAAASPSSSKKVNTPQMEALLEKMAARGTKNISKTSKVREEKDSIISNEKEPRSKLKRQSLLERSDASSISSSENGIRCETRTPKAVATRKSLSQECESNEIKVITQKRNQVSLKKNLGKERMEKLRDSLEKQRDANNSTLIHSPSLFGNKLSTFYKHATVRLTRLEDETVRKKLLSKERTCFNKQSESANSFEDMITIRNNDTLRDSLTRRSNGDTINEECEEMDWEPMEVEKITHEVQAVRTQLCAENNTRTSCCIVNTLKYPALPEQQARKHLYIVVDTNVFLSNIDAIELARETTFDIYDKPVIVIPWTVIRELDYIKDHSKTRPATLCASARKAIKYINTLFSSKQSRIMTQTPEDVERNKAKFSTNCPDDEILQTCLQVRDLGTFVVLLSYDINLCNKAMIYDILTLGKNDTLEKIGLTIPSSKSVPVSDSNNIDRDRSIMDSKSIVDLELSLASDIYEDAKSIIRDFLTVIVSKEMHSLYGESWEKYVFIKPPWTTITVLRCAIKHWIAIVSESFMKNADVVMKELLQIFKDTSDKKTLEERGNVLDKCSVLVQMIDTSKHSDLMVRASRKIEELREKRDEFVSQVNEKKLQRIIGVENDVEERENRAQKAFQFFEAAYVYARDMCGLASKSMGIVCNFHYNIPNPAPSLVYLEQIRPRLARNVNQLATNLIDIIEQARKSCINMETLFNLHDTLINFLPENATRKLINVNLTPLDVYYCIKNKEDVLIRGLCQLQELNNQYAQLASCRSA